MSVANSRLNLEAASQVFKRPELTPLDFKIQNFIHSYQIFFYKLFGRNILDYKISLIFGTLAILTLTSISYYQKNKIYVIYVVTYALTHLKKHLWDHLICRKNYRDWDQINDQIILGEQPSSLDLKKLQKENVTFILTCQRKEEKSILISRIRKKDLKDTSIQRIRIEAIDFDPVSQEGIRKGVEALEKHFASHPQGKAYVHCKSGRGRSTTIVICFLLKKKIEKLFANEATLDSLEKAQTTGQTSQDTIIEHVRKSRPQIALNLKQRNSIDIYRTHLLNTWASKTQ